ncbi:MAG: error-prone DNA polymerase, partial [Phycisphaerae bacterium]|nr:error-prone DNA polymerase [Phycisphaerae bacterium]
ELGYGALAITDTNTLAGIVRAHVAARDVDLQLVVGARLRLSDVPDMSLLVYPTDLASYGRLCHVLTRGKRRASKGDCHLETIDLADAGEGWIVAAVAPRVPDDAFANWLRRLGEMFRARRLFLAASFGYQQDDRDRIHALADLADHLHLPLLATNNVYYHRADRQSLQDVLACIRHGCMLETAGRRLLANAERHLKSAGEMAALFADWPGALESSLEIAERTRRFTLDQVRYQYPGEVIPSGRTAMTYLGEVTWAGADRRYPRGVPTKVQSQIRHELELIEELNYAHYFLTVYDIACFARSRDILYQGRGAAANSAVCYCLFVTSVDPDRVNVLFERFISRERDEPPDIDIDFEHERREEVIQYLYAKYGRDRAALTAEVITYRWRSALREVGKVLGLPPDTLEKFSSAVEGWSGKRMEDEQIRAMGLDPAAMVVRHLLDLAEQLLGFPRHLSQHVGGFVITEDPLCRLVPIENAAMADRTVIEWDKDDIEAMGMLKVDLLGLGMLTCIRKCFALIEEHHQRRLTLADVPADDPAVYDMICRADTVGVFQIESRAQMSMLPRLRPRCYYDLVIEVAIVRPGPIQGDMVHPYLRRRSGQEPVTYPDDTVKQILERTLGVPLFQEQAMTLAIRCAGFTPGEADDLRRAIAAWRHKTKVIDQFGRRIMEGMIGRGYEKEFAQRCFDQIKGFSGYGFPESHAASFALLAYVSAYLKHHYPAAFACALLNSQPMGFYAPAQIVRDAQEHGVEVRPVDVHHSQWDCTLESGGRALRLGMRRIRGMRKEEGRAVAGAFESGNSPRSIERLWRQSGVRVSTLKHLALADAFASMGLDRQQALWKILPLRD